RSADVPSRLALSARPAMPFRLSRFREPAILTEGPDRSQGFWMFISRLRYQSERPERAARARLPQADHAPVGGVHRVQPLARKGIKGLAVAEARLLRGVELGARQMSEQPRERQQMLHSR